MNASRDSDLASPFRDPDFRLNATDRDRLDQAFSADVVEELLARYESIERRAAALNAFLEMADQTACGALTITGMSTSDEHPEVDALVRRLVRQRVPFKF